MKFKGFLYLIFIGSFFLCFIGVKSQGFSNTFSKFFTSRDFIDSNKKIKKEYVWVRKTKNTFTELILSWNAFRPKKGSLDFFVSIYHNGWSSWKKIAQWGVRSQKTFVNTRHPIIHVKHVRTELQKGQKSTRFRIKVIAKNGADIRYLKALFVSLSDMKKFSVSKFDTSKPKVYVKNVPRQSQMVVGHSRFRDICSPVSLSMILNYYDRKHLKSFIGGISNFAAKFADLVHDDSYLDIYGNWILNVAQAFDSSKGNVFFRVQRFNNFDELYRCLQKNIPVAVSIRAKKLKGSAKSYHRGHFVVVIGWNPKYKSVICLDPAFSSSKKTITAYRINDFESAWGTSRNLSYMPIPRRFRLK